MKHDIPHTDWIYDIETYLDLFCVDLTHAATRTRYIFEVSDRRNQSVEMIAFLYQLRDAGARLFGYNNEGFDWPVMQHLMQWDNGRGFYAQTAHDKGTAIITSHDRFAHNLWPSDRIVTQGDLYKIHHFDNMSRSTSLKKLEINMRSNSVVDLPYPPDQPTTSEQKDEIIAYMCHDVSETFRFYVASLDQIRFRDELAEKYPDMGDVLNMNDTKIGKKFFERELERQGVPCYHRPNGRKERLQTHRDHVALRDVISPRVTFNHPEFQRVKTYLEGVRLGPKTGRDAHPGGIETKGVFNDLSATIDGFKYDFGTGGIHGSLHGVTVREDDEWEIWDWDVASYYPNLAISNRWFPAHLSETFCDVYETVYDMRKQHGKGTAENAMLKLALNGVYGDSNSKYSPFFDPQYTMSITVNGQLYLCMLAEWLVRTHDFVDQGDIQMVQINTDGLTVKIRKHLVDYMKETCAAWEKHTGLELESVRYKAMHIRDVNSYLAEKTDGGIKRIGAYAYETPLDNLYTRERQWHQDHSMLVVRKAAEAAMVHGTPVEEFIMNHRDPFDFMLSVKVNKSANRHPCYLYHGDEQIQNTSRYYVSTDGAPLNKCMVKRNATEYSDTGIDVGWMVTVVNDASLFRWDNVNWLYYIEEARKLVI